MATLSQVLLYIEISGSLDIKLVIIDSNSQISVNLSCKLNLNKIYLYDLSVKSYSTN